MKNEKILDDFWLPDGIPIATCETCRSAGPSRNGTQCVLCELTALTTGFDEMSAERDLWKNAWTALYETMVTHGQTATRNADPAAVRRAAGCIRAGHSYRESEVCEHARVQVLTCETCGHVSVGWEAAHSGSGNV